MDILEFTRKKVAEATGNNTRAVTKSRYTDEEANQLALDLIKREQSEQAYASLGTTTIQTLQNDIQGLKIPTVADNVPKTTGGYYSRPVVVTSGVEDIQKRMESLSNAMQHVSYPVEKAKRDAENAAAELQTIGTALKSAYEAYSETPTWQAAQAYNQALAAYQNAKTKYESAYSAYDTAYNQYKTVRDSADEVFSAWKTYVGDSQASYDAWKGTIRDADVVKQELDAVEARIKELEPISSGVMNIVNLLGNAAANAAASSSSLAPVPATTVAESPELAKLKAQRELLQEEYDWAVHSDQIDIRSTPYFGSLSENDRLMVIDMTEIENMSQEDHEAFGKWLIYRGVDASDEVKALEAKYTKERLEELESSLRRYQNQKSAQETVRKAQKAADGVAGGIWASLASVGTNVWNALTSPLAVAQELLWYDDRYGNLDPNGPGFKAGIWSGAVRDTVGKNIAGDVYDEKGNQTEDGGWIRQGLSTLYGAGMSAADNLARLAVGFATGGGSTVTLGLAAMGSFGDTVRQISDQGGDPVQALAMGVISGGLEVLTEKYSVENILKVAKGNPLNFKNTLKEMLKQGAIEVSEEEINFLASTLAEAAIMQDKSSYNLEVKELMAAGMSEAEAREQANLSLLAQAGETAVQSFLSGGMMTGTVSTVNNVRFSSLGQKLGLGDVTREQAQAIIDSGLESAEDTEAYQLAQNLQKKLDAGNVPTKSELAQQLMANQQAIQAEEQKTQEQQPGTYISMEEDTDEETEEQPYSGEDVLQTKNELYRQMVQQNQNGGNVNVETGNDAGAVPGNLVSDGSQGWNAGTGTGEQDGSLAEGTAIREEGPQSGATLAGNQGTGFGEAAANRSGDSRIKTLQSLASQLKLSRVSSLSLGIPEGTEKTSIRVLPQEAWTPELQSVAQNVQQETGLPVTFVLGRIPVKNRRSGVRAVYTPTGIIIQADNLGATPQQLADHETYHFKADAARRSQMNQRVAERLLETYTPEELSRALDKYKENLVGLVDDEGMTEGEFLEAFTDAVLEEFLADAYAGINAFGAHAERYQADVESAMDELYMGKVRNQDNGTRQTNGPNENTAGSGGARYSYEGDAEDGRGMYRSNFPKGTPKQAKSERILHLIESVWSKKPIMLKIEENGGERFILAEFDPYYDESGNIKTDASKIAGGNRRGNRSERRVTLDLAEDLYQIAEGSRYDYSRDEEGKDTYSHENVQKWHYFINDIYFAEYDSKEYEPYRITINVKEKPDGHYVYSFSAKKQEESSTHRTLTADVNDVNNTANAELSKISIRNPEENVKHEEWVDVDELPFNAQMQAQLEGRYDHETKKVRVNKPKVKADEKTVNSQAVENPKQGKSKFSADDLSAMEEELQMRESQEYQDRLMEDGGSAAWVTNQKRIEVLRQQMKRDPETIQKRNERDLQSEGTEPAKVRMPKKRDAKKPAPVSESKPILAKQDLRKNLLHFFSVPEGQRQELGVVIDGYADRLIKNGALTEDDRRRFFDRMYASGVMEVPADEVYTAGRELLRGGRIYVNDSIRAEFGDDWQDFRQQAFAAGVYLTNNPHDGGVDHVNSYMADYLPSLFDSEETDLRMALERIVQVAEEGKSQQVSLAEYTAQLAGEQHVPESEFLDAMERHLDWALRTFAEKAELEVKLRDRTGVKIAQEREVAAQSRYKQSAREEVRRLKERKQRMELREQQRQEKELRELQQKTLKSLQWLSKNRQRAPEELRETWDEVLGDIDLFAVSAANEMRWSDRYGATWKDLAEMYQEAKDKDPNFMPSKDLERIVSRLNDKKIGEMDIGALQDLYKAAVGLQKEFHNRNNVINDEMNRMFEEVYEDSKAEIEGAPGGYKGKFMDKLFNMQQLTPMNVLQRMGGWNPDGTFFSMAKQLERGERDVRAYTVKANRILEDFLTEYEDWVKKCDGQGKDGIWYEMEVPELLELNMGHKPIFGDTFKVYFTPAQKVHMYLESKNEDNLRHMLGGRTFVDKKLYSEGKRQEALSQGRPVRLAPETVKAMVANLTDEERALADVLERYYNAFAKEEINRVSNALYGYDRAMGKNYAPIFSDQNYTKTELGIYDETAEGVGHMKGRIAYSKNPSYNISALDAFEKHVDQTARFVGMTIPARNWNTFLSWRDENNVTTRSVVAQKWGEEGAVYIEGIIEDIQSGKKAPETGVWSQLAEKALRNYISAVFGANPSIVLKQMGSVPMAAPYLDFRNLPTLAQIKNIDRDLIAKYTQELAWRTMGYATPETKELKDNPNWTQTNKPVRFVFGGGAITAMDGWAASTLWPWAENKVRRDFPDLEAGTDAYYKKVAEEFEYAMSRSQSVSDEIHQSTLRKSRNPVDRLFTMFRSDSAQTYNTIRQKIGEARYYKRIGADKKTQQKANKAVGTAFVASLSGLIWGEGISLLMALWKNKGKKYRDDEDELTAESIMGEAAMNLVSSMAGTMIGGEELAGILGNILMGEKWYDLETPGMEQLNEIINALTDAGGGVRDIVTGAWEIAQNDGDVGKYLGSHAGDIAGGVKDLAETAAKYFAGLPVANVEAYLLGLFKWVTPELATAYEDALSTVEKAGLSGLTGEALEARVGNVMEQRGVDSDVAMETLSSLYEEGYSSVVPGAVPSKVTIKKEEKELNAYQKQVYGNIWGSIVAEYLEGVVSSELFADADAKIQSELIQALYSYADAKAKVELFDDYELSGSIKGMDDALKSGLSMEKVLDLKVNREKEETASGAQGYTGKLKDYMEMVGNGVDPDEAHGLIMYLEELEPMEGEDRVVDVQKWRTCVDMYGNPDFQLAALGAYMSDAQFKKAKAADSLGVDLSDFVKVYEIRAKYDENGNKSFSNSEYKKAIDSLSLSTQNSAVLWQLFAGTKSAKNNPYSVSIGQKVLDALGN